MQEAGGTSEHQVCGLSPFCIAVRRPRFRAVTPFTRMPYLRLLSFLAFQRPQRPDSIHQGTAICMMGNHIHGLDSHELPAIAPSPGGKKTREARTSAV
jgi:hypothetical protein